MARKQVLLLLCTYGLTIMVGADEDFYDYEDYENFDMESDYYYDDTTFEDWRLSGGFNATQGAPYVVRIQPKTPDGTKRPICGGALVNTTIILTSAFCMYGATGADVMAGAVNLDVNSTETGVQHTIMTQIYYHPNFFRNTRENDLAVMRVHPAFNTKKTVNIIRMGKKPLIARNSLANKTVVWTSYGMVSEFSDAVALQYALIRPIKIKACKIVFRRRPYFIKVPKSVECIKVSATTGICQGDLGSPIVYYNPKDKKNPITPYLAGLATWNHDKNCPPNKTLAFNTPDWFTRVDPFYKWIHALGGAKRPGV